MKEVVPALGRHFVNPLNLKCIQGFLKCHILLFYKAPIPFDGLIPIVRIVAVPKIENSERGGTRLLAACFYFGMRNGWTLFDCLKAFLKASLNHVTGHPQHEVDRQSEILNPVTLNIDRLSVKPVTGVRDLFLHALQA